MLHQAYSFFEFLRAQQQFVVRQVENDLARFVDEEVRLDLKRASCAGGVLEQDSIFQIFEVGTVQQQVVLVQEKAPYVLL